MFEYLEGTRRHRGSVTGSSSALGLGHKSSTAATLDGLVENMTYLLKEMKEREDITVSTHAAVNAAADRVAATYLKSKDDAYHDVCKELWKYQESLSREKIQAEKLANPSKHIVDNSLQPNGSDIVLLWGYTRNYPEKHSAEMIQQITQNRESYCAKHGYTNMMVYFDDYMPKGKQYEDMAKAWLKVYAIKDAYKKHPNAKWFFWLDVDAIIMDESIDLASHILHPSVLTERTLHGAPIGERGKTYKGKFSKPKDKFNPEEIEFIAAQDSWFLNAGVLLMKNTEFMKNMVSNKWLTEKNIVRKELVFAEQDVLNDIIMEDPEMFKRWAPTPQWVMNAYHDTYNFEPSRWVEGDFIAHFPGESPKESYAETWQRYWAKRVV